MDRRRLEMTVLMTPDMANFSGKVHGGALLNLLDRVAFSCAMRRHTNSCYFTMVVVDDEGRPSAVPALAVSGPTEERRYKAAELRRTLRREITARLEAVAETGVDSGG